MANIYRSQTSATTLDALPEALGAALRAHAAAHQIDLTGARFWLTHSENPPGEGLFASMFGRRANPVDPDAEHWTLVVLQRTHLALGTLGAKRGCAVLSLPLLQASVSRQSALAARMGAATPSEFGLYVSGLPGEHGRPGTYMAKLGQDGEGEACYAAVEAAIVAAKRAQ